MDTFDSSVESLFTGAPEDDSHEKTDEDSPGETIAKIDELSGEKEMEPFVSSFEPRVLGVIDYSDPENPVFYAAGDAGEGTDQESGTTPGPEPETYIEPETYTEPENQMPEASDDTRITDENTVMESAVPAATDADGTIESYQLVDDVGAGNGTLSFNTDGTYLFDPGTDFDHLADGESRDVTFTYTATDNDGGVSDAHTVTITVTGTNDLPLASDDTVTTDMNTVLESAVPAAHDVDGTIDSYHLVDDVGAGNGSLSFNADGTYLFDPGTDFDDLAEGESRDVTFTYNVMDNDGGVCDPHTVTITVTCMTGPNENPVASDDTRTTGENTLLESAVPAATDADGTIDSYQLVDGVGEGNGTLSFNVDGTYIFDPGTDFDHLADGESRDVTFTYTATDNDGGVSDVHTVTITVTGTNDLPVAGNDTVTTDLNTVLESAVPAATDVDGTIESYQLVDGVGAGNGSLSFNADGTYSFDPGNDFDGLNNGESRNVTFTYTATDNDGGVSTAKTVTITVTGMISTNQIPVAVNDTQTTEENTVLESAVPAATDEDGTIVSYQVVDGVGAGNGSLSFNADGTYSFDPGTDFDHLAEGENRNVIFTYTATDNDGGMSDAKTVTIIVTGTNDVPVASDDIQTTDKNTVLISSVPPATDVDGTIDSYQLKEGVGEGNGTLSFNEDGSFSFDPGEDFSELNDGGSQDVIFTYTATDNDEGVSDVQTVTITVTGSDPDQLIEGTNGIDYLTGGSGNDQIYGFDGDDELYGLAGNDALYGGAGNDFLDGGPGDDFLDGGEFEGRHPGNIASYQDDPGGITASMLYDGNNVNPFEGSLVIDGWGDTDTLTNITRIKGSAYDDNITIDIVNSVGLRWYIWGMDGADTITGSDGTLVRVMYLEDPAGVTVNLEEGTATDGWGKIDTLNNIYSVSGSHHNDNLTGSSRNDVFFGTLGDDTIDGLGGRDWISYAWMDQEAGFNGVDVDLSSNFAKGYDLDGILLFTDQLFNIEMVQGSIHDDTLIGNDANNWLWGLQGNDDLDGGVFEGKFPGNIAIYQDDPDGITATMVYDGNNDNPFAGSTVIDGWGTTDTLTNITRIKGSAYDDDITITVSNSDALRWYVWGMDGADTITGSDGTLVRAMYLDDPAGVSVNLGEGTATDGWGKTDTLNSIYAVSGSNYGNDTLTGSSDNNGFFGSLGNDVIDGVGGWNWISYGWIPHDGFNGMEIDLLEGYAEGYDSMGGSLFFDTLSNINEAWGSALNDTIYGNDSDNWLGGEDGDDHLYGGDGWNTLIGGQGNDFLYGGEFQGRHPRTTASYQDDPAGITANYGI
jgi:VCBS repeat-containing protein